MAPTTATARPSSAAESTTSSPLIEARRPSIAGQSRVASGAPTRAGSMSISDARGRFNAAHPSLARTICAYPPTLLEPRRAKPANAARCAASPAGSTVTWRPRRRVAAASASPRPARGRTIPAGTNDGAPDAGPVRYITPDEAQTLAQRSSSTAAIGHASTTFEPSGSRAAVLPSRHLVSRSRSQRSPAARAIASLDLSRDSHRSRPARSASGASGPAICRSGGVL